MTAPHQLAQLQSDLSALEGGSLLAAPFVQRARQADQLRSALPEKFTLVLDDLLDRLESGALFSEESCSFSQRDLLDGLKLWCEKALLRLNS